MRDQFAAATKAFAENALFKNSLALVSGTVATQAIVFLFSPVLSRIFGLVDFGNLANYNGWVAVLALVSSLRYEHAIIVARGKENTNRVITLTALLSIASFIAYTIAAGALFLLYSGNGYLRELRSIALFIPCGVLAVCLTSLFIQFNVKTGKFRRLATVSAAQVIFTIIPQIILGILLVKHALIIGTIVGFAISGCLFGWLYFRENSFSDLLKEMTRHQLLLTVREHIDFPRYALAADAVGVVSQQFIPVLVLAFFNPAVAGLYSFSIRIVRVPLLVISTAVGGALRKEAIDQVHSGTGLTALFWMTVSSLFLLAAIPFAVVLLYGQGIFAVVFGSRWTEAGRVVQILSPGILFEFVALPLAAFFLVTNTQRYTFAIQSAGLALLVAALWTGKHFFNDFVATCYLVSGAMVVMHLMSILLAARVSGVQRAKAKVTVS